MSQAIATARDVPDPQIQAPVAPPRKRRWVRPLLMLGGIVVAAAGSLAFWLHGGRTVSIDNAYVRADKLVLSTDVSGLIAEVPVHEGQEVHRGDVVFRLDDRQFRIGLEAAEAKLDQTRLELDAAKRDYERMLRDVAAKRAQVEADQARFDRTHELVGRGDVSRQAYDDARFQLLTDQQGYEAAKVTAEVQLARLGGDAGADVATLPAYRQSEAQVQEARRQLDHATVRASMDGVVTGVDAAQPGMYLAASAGAFGLVASATGSGWRRTPRRPS
jgi:membrane fusion protein, multidrug efflux system